MFKPVLGIQGLISPDGRSFCKYMPLYIIPYRIENNDNNYNNNKNTT